MQTDSGSTDLNAPVPEPPALITTTGLVGFALLGTGVVLLAVGIILHVTATARSRKLMPGRPPGVVNVGGNHGIHNENYGQMSIHGGQVVTSAEAAQALDDLRRTVDAAALQPDVRLSVARDLADAQAAVRRGDPGRPEAAASLERAVTTLGAVGQLAAAGTALVGPMQTLVSWLGTAGAGLVRLLAGA
jgi:hypothetical protein